jgi:hypothetical protein
MDTAGRVRSGATPSAADDEVLVYLRLRLAFTRALAAAAGDAMETMDFAALRAAVASISRQAEDFVATMSIGSLSAPGNLPSPRTGARQEGSDVSDVSSDTDGGASPLPHIPSSGGADAPHPHPHRRDSGLLGSVPDTDRAMLVSMVGMWCRLADAIAAVGEELVGRRRPLVLLHELTRGRRYIEQHVAFLSGPVARCAPDVAAKSLGSAGGSRGQANTSYAVHKAKMVHPVSALLLQVYWGFWARSTVLAADVAWLPPASSVSPPNAHQPLPSTLDLQSMLDDAGSAGGNTTPRVDRRSSSTLSDRSNRTNDATASARSSRPMSPSGGGTTPGTDSNRGTGATPRQRGAADEDARSASPAAQRTTATPQRRRRSPIE